MGCDDCFFLGYRLTALRKSDLYLGGATQYDIICKLVSAVISCVAFSRHVHIQKNLESQNLRQPLMVLNGWSFSGTGNPLGFFSFSLTNPISDAVLYQSFSSKNEVVRKNGIFQGG